MFISVCPLKYKVGMEIHLSVCIEYTRPYCLSSVSQSKQTNLDMVLD